MFSAYVLHSEEILDTQALLKLSKRPTHASAGKLVNVLRTIDDLAVKKVNAISTAYSSPLAVFVTDCDFLG